jgi:hypothetical protein
MKGRVEAGHLRQSRVYLGERFNGGKRMGLVKRRQGDQPLQIGKYGRVQQHGRSIEVPAMGNPMPGGNQALIGEVAVKPTQQQTECIFMGCSFPQRPSLMSSARNTTPMPPTANVPSTR